VDIFATLAEIIGLEIPDGAAEDSVSFLPVLKGATTGFTRSKPFIQHSSKGQFAIVDPAGKWKFLNGTMGGGNATTIDADNKVIHDAIGKIGGEPGQLYDLHKDPGERTNLLLGNPSQKNLATLEALKRQLEDIVGDDGPPPGEVRKPKGGNEVKRNKSEEKNR
jgi:arylsulfatase A-like enzyme